MGRNPKAQFASTTTQPPPQAQDPSLGKAIARRRAERRWTFAKTMLILIIGIVVGMWVYPRVFHHWDDYCHPYPAGMVLRATDRLLYIEGEPFYSYFATDLDSTIKCQAFLIGERGGDWRYQEFGGAKKAEPRTATNTVIDTTTKQGDVPQGPIINVGPDK